MIAADSSVVIDFMNNASGKHVEALVSALQGGDITLPPVVLSEVLSDPLLPPKHRNLLVGWPILDIWDGYWMRAGHTRAGLLKINLRARLPDVLIAQSCIDHGVPLIARDTDFRHFAKHCGLKLA